MVLTNFECWAHDDAIGDRASLDILNSRSVSHIASNGYYGYAFLGNNNNNNSNTTNNNNNIANITPASETQHQCDVGNVGQIPRCKKRMAAGGEDALSFAIGGGEMGGGDIAAKRCRYNDDGDLTAQYFNDFFSLPVSPGIGTQVCLMDYDMEQQPPQQQQQPPPELIPRMPVHSYYQGHLHRTNRDVSRCMMSHMI